MGTASRLTLLPFLLAAPLAAQIPTIEYPDTRRFVGFRTADSATAIAMIQLLRDAQPNETALCLYGFAKDTLLASGYLGHLATIDSVAVAIQDSAGPGFVATVEDPVGGCEATPNFIGIAHDHMIGAWYKCEHSDPQDVVHLATVPKAWFSLVLCSDGRAAILWQDGRRTPFWWMDPKPKEP